MLDKSICDCNKSVRDLLRDAGIIDYDELEAGGRHKFKATLQVRGHKEECDVSCYRSNGRGDARIWITKVKQYAEAGDVLEIKAGYDEIHVRLRKTKA